MSLLTVPVLLALALAVALSGCGDKVEDDVLKPAGSSNRAGSAGDASCALLVRFRGAVYEGLNVEVAPSEGDSLGSGVLPACDDGHGASADEEIELAEVEGVSPDIAVSWPGRWDVVLVRRGVALPPEIEGLRKAPSCEPRDAPIELSGPWDGILGADGETELDLEPPYDVYVIVDEASEPRYERAYLTVRVPRSLGKPITRDDIRASLWEGGTIAARVHCSGDGGFAAEAVEALPPT
jgi:Family of unknown function (DUF6281)